MRNFSKKILAGLLSGAILFTGATTFASPPEMPDNDDRPANHRHFEREHNPADLAKHFADRYGVDRAQVEAALNDKVHIEDIRSAAILAKLSGKSFSEVLAMKVGWDKVADKLGVTREQLKNFREQERTESLAKRAGIDVNTLKSLLKDGYGPRDITIAGKIAKASGKDIKTVLGKRKINNSWDDVAKSFGVDMKKIMPPPPHGHQRDK